MLDAVVLIFVFLFVSYFDFYVAFVEGLNGVVCVGDVFVLLFAGLE